MILAAGKTYTKPALLEDITREFGADARFFTCSAESLSAAELIDFLEAKGKLVPLAGGLGAAKELMCDH